MQNYSTFLKADICIETSESGKRYLFYWCLHWSSLNYLVVMYLVACKYYRCLWMYCNMDYSSCTKACNGDVTLRSHIISFPLAMSVAIARSGDVMELKVSNHCKGEPLFQLSIMHNSCWSVSCGRGALTAQAAFNSVHHTETSYSNISFLD